MIRRRTIGWVEEVVAFGPKRHRRSRILEVTVLVSLGLLAFLTMEYAVVRWPWVTALRSIETGDYGRAVRASEVAVGRTFEPILRSFVAPVAAEAADLAQWQELLDGAEARSSLENLRFLQSAAVGIRKCPHGSGISRGLFDLALLEADRSCTDRNYAIGTEFLMLAEALLPPSPGDSVEYQEATDHYRAYEKTYFPVLGLDRTVLWGRADRDPVAMILRCTKQTRPMQLVVRSDSGSGVTLCVSMNGAEASIGPPGGGCTAGEGSLVQIGEHDFSGDGEPEIVVAVADPGGERRVYVIWHFPPAQWDVVRPADWETSGPYCGLSPVHVSGASIIFEDSAGSPTAQFMWVGGQFVRVP